jgi:hypothetical protein
VCLLFLPRNVEGATPRVSGALFEGAHCLRERPEGCDPALDKGLYSMRIPAERLRENWEEVEAPACDILIRTNAVTEIPLRFCAAHLRSCHERCRSVGGRLLQRRGAPTAAAGVGELCHRRAAGQRPEPRRAVRA